METVMAADHRPPGLTAIMLESIVDLIDQPETKVVLGALFGKKFMCKFPGGQIYFESKLALDTDGSRFAIPDAKGHREDPSGRITTSARDADGNFLDAETINYFVLPGGFAGKHGIRIGDIAVVFNGIAMAFACFGDVGPAGSLGEGSIALHRDLGHETVVGGHLLNDSISSGVVTIVFPGSGNGLGRTSWESERIGQPLFTKLKAEAEQFNELRRAEKHERWLREEDARHVPRRRLHNDPQ
jgi:hypothetical protein